MVKFVKWRMFLVVDVNQDSFPVPIREVGKGKGCESHLTFDFLLKMPLLVISQKK